MQFTPEDRFWQSATPPNYVAVFDWRMRRFRAIKGNAANIKTTLEYYRTRPVEFINDWCDTYDPRNAIDPKALTTMPMVLFPRQKDLVEFLWQLLETQANGLVEKSRDMGATWVAVGFSVWLWLFYPGAAIGWGSRNKGYVDEIGDPKSIFEKIRITIRRLPKFFWPEGFDPEKHMPSMRIVNPATGSTIIGEIGDGIGRGGRTLIYFKDEGAHYEHPDSIDAALSNNTRIQVDISSVNGLGNPFYRKRDAGVVWEPGQPMVRNRVNVFIMDWSENPMHTQEWFDNMQETHEAQGQIHLFNQEVLRDYSGSNAAVIIPAKYVRACRDAHRRIPGMTNGPWRAAYDPADEGGDAHAAGAVKNVVLKRADQWFDGDTTQGTVRVIEMMKDLAPLQVEFDSVGIGAGVKGEANRRRNLPKGHAERLPDGMIFVAWNAGGGVLDPDKPIVELMNADGKPLLPGNTTTNKEQYANLKGQAWWSLFVRCMKTFKCIEALNAGKELPYGPDELFSIDTDSIPPEIAKQLEKELSTPVRKKLAPKVTVDKKPDGNKSPNLADMVVMAMFPVPIEGYDWSAFL